MGDELLVEIEALCQALDQKTADTYQLLAAHAEDADIGAFWQELAADEREHVTFWSQVSELVERGALPQMFDRPVKVKEELTAIVQEAAALLEAATPPEIPEEAFLLAYRLESFLLHPAFATLFHIMRGLTGARNPGESYDEHLRKIGEAMRQRGAATPALELIANLMRRLWKATRRMTLQSRTDGLTGVLNRRGLVEMMLPFAYYAKRAGAAVAVLMIDIDHLRRINSQHGYQAGDEVLRSVASILRTDTRRSDLLGRYEGEVFLLYLSAVQPGSLQFVAEKLRQHVERETADRIPVTVCIGGAQTIFKKDVEAEMDILIKCADDNLHEAMERGPNTSVVTTECPAVE